MAAAEKTSRTHTSHVYSLETFTAAFDSILSPPVPTKSVSVEAASAQTDGAADETRQQTPQQNRLTQTDILILLTHLSRDLHAASVSPLTSSNPTIKLHPPSPSKTPQQQEITQQDHAIANLHTLAHRLAQQISHLEARVTNLEHSIRSLVSTSPTSAATPARQKALTLLRQKKLAQQTLQRRQQSLEQVQQSLDGIEEAAGQVEVVRAMEASAGVLRGLSAQVGGVENVERVMDDVAEAREEVQDVAGVLAEGGAAVDEGEVDEELAELEREEETRREAAREKESEARLPDAPSAEPRVRERGRQSDEVEKRLSLLSLAAAEEKQTGFP